jgi:predicted transcriptional regulator
MGSLLELTANIVSSHVLKTSMPSSELLHELQRVYRSLRKLAEEVSHEAKEAAHTAPRMTFKQAFGKDQVSCMVCGRSGFKTLARHIQAMHHLKPGAYRRQFGIPSSQALTARDFSEARKKMASEKHVADILVKARAVRAANVLANLGTAEKTTYTFSVEAPKGRTFTA